MLCDILSYIFCCLYVLAEHDRVHATVKRELYNVESLLDLFVRISLFDMFQLADKTVELFLVGRCCGFQCFRHDIVRIQQILQRFVEYIYLLRVIIGVLCRRVFALVNLVSQHADACIGT